MATITPYETKAGKRYRVRYRKPDGAQTDKRGFKTKREAQLFAATVTVSKATGEYIDPSRGRATIAQLAPAWFVSKEGSLKPSAYYPLVSTWKNHIEETWGHREITSIEPTEVKTWVGKLAAKRSSTVVARAVGVLAGILDDAVEDRRIHKNPARGIKVKKKKGKARLYLTHDQVHRLAAASEHPALVLTLAYTGIRWGESAGLRVRNINELRRRLSIEENAVSVAGVVHLGTPKTHEKRTVPYPAFLGPRLAQVAKGKPQGAFLFGDGSKPLLIPHSFRGWFNVAVESVQTDDEAFPRVTLHDLRHTAASLAISAGANVKAVQRMLGHASAAMTLDTYADLFEDDLDGVAARLGDAAREAGEGKAWGDQLGA